ncbi:MAG: DUF983 domain-containing protein [Alphaproteobacteria bacterium]|nr:DUF983 domain-containing protein [Alphaproteobacteria bacterium]
MSNSSPLFWQDLQHAFSCTCPRCRQGALYVSRFSFTVRDTCPICGLALSRHDAADGPAVFLIFVLGFLLVPMALVMEFALMPPLWVHAVVWTVVALGLTLGTLKPLKTFILALQYRHRPET